MSLLLYVSLAICLSCYMSLLLYVSLTVCLSYYMSLTILLSDMCGAEALRRSSVERGGGVRCPPGVLRVSCCGCASHPLHFWNLPRVETNFFFLLQRLSMTLTSASRASQWPAPSSSLCPQGLFLFHQKSRVDLREKVRIVRRERE